MKDIGHGPIVERTSPTPFGAPTGPITKVATLTIAGWWCCSVTTSGGRIAAAWQPKFKRKPWLPYVSMRVLLLPLQQQCQRLPQRSPAPVDGWSLLTAATLSTLPLSRLGAVQRRIVVARVATWLQYTLDSREISLIILLHPGLTLSGLEELMPYQRYWHTVLLSSG